MDINLPANLDDGELWIPSDIFPTSDDEIEDTPNHHHQNHHDHHRPRGMDDLSRYFSNLDVRDRHRFLVPQTPPPPPQRLGVFGPMAQYALTAPRPNGCYGMKVGPPVDRGLCSYRTGPTYSAPDPALRYPMHKPPVRPQHQAAPGRLVQTRRARSRPVQGHQNRPQNRPLPFQANGFQLNSFMKDWRGSSSTAGTGVFIPSANPHNKITTHDSGKKKMGASPHSGSGRKVGVAKEDYYYYHQVPPSASDVGLPKEWAYTNNY